MVEFTSAPSINSVATKTGLDQRIPPIMLNKYGTQKRADKVEEYEDLKKYKREKSVLLEKHTAKAMQFKRTLVYPATSDIFHLKKKKKESFKTYYKLKGRTNDIGNVKVDSELGWSLLITSHDKRERQRETSIILFPPPR